MFTKDALIKNVDNEIYFEEEGRVFITTEKWNENGFSMKFKNIRETIGFSPKYINEQNFMYITISKDEIIVSARIKGIDRIYKQINKLNLLEENIITYENIYDSKHCFTLNGVEIYRLDSSLFLEGQVFIFAKKGETISECQIEQMQSIAWKTNGDERGVLIKSYKLDHTNMFRLQTAGQTEAKIYQTISMSNTSATLSFDFIGTGTVLLNDSVIKEVSSQELIRTEVCLGYLNDDVQKIEFRTSEELHIGKVQLEENAYATDYIPNNNTDLEAVREGTVLIYPNKDIFLEAEGSLYIKITPKKTLTNHTIFKTDSEEFILTCIEGTIYWTAHGQTVSLPYTKSKNKTTELFVTWSPYDISLSLDKEIVADVSLNEPSLPVNRLIFADGQSIEPVVLEAWAAFKNAFSMELDISEYIENATSHSLFDGGINGNNISWAEIPIAPNDNSPILVEKRNGDPLQKVSFFDTETGDYRTWNEEAFVYDGKSDFFNLSFPNINEQFSNLSIITSSGEVVGRPYTIKGKRMYFSFSEHEKIIYKNETLKAVYQVRDSYTVDYNFGADGYRLDFANHDGTDRLVYQEGNRVAEPVKLATMIEMNPIYNHNHTGFIYVSKTEAETSDFRITATPDRLRADGYSKATLVIEPLDHQGNFLSHVNLSVKADKGFISRHINKASAEAQKRSGQHLYEYTAPFISSREKVESVLDTIWVVDEDSNIGICYSILLGPAESAHKLQMTAAEKNILRNKTILMNAIIMYESLEVNEDTELFGILDLNGDSKITLDEIDVLSQNKKDVELSAIVQKLEKWRGDEKRASTQRPD